jgi:ubiquinone/menaquinone biosynthesis C-methylase UbiE
MERVLEPELMDDEAQSRAYAKADFSASNQRFVDGLIQDFAACLGRVVDLGCGPGDVDIRLARAVPGAAITAVDGSAPMIALARSAVGEARLDGRIALLRGVLPDLPLGAHRFDAVLSKDLLHHLPDPAVLWREVVRLGRAGAAVYVMDLIRPDTPDAARRIVDAVAASEDAILRQDFLNSLGAAFTIDEVAGQLRSAGLDRLEVVRSGDRHLLVRGFLP